MGDRTRTRRIEPLRKRISALRLALPPLLMVLNGCCTIPLTPSGAPVCSGVSGDTKSASWFLTDSPSPRGVILVVHGLNNKPELMQPLIAELTASGFHALRLSLVREGTDLEQHWRQQLEAAYCEAGRRFPDLPRSAAAYSMGAALVTDFMARFPDHRLQSAVLFAPALSLPKFTALLRPLLPLRVLGLGLPSFAPGDYTAKPFTSLRAYQGLYNVIDGLRSTEDVSGLAKPRVLVLMRPNDELVSFTGLQRWIAARQLSKWKLEALSSQCAGVHRFAHLIMLPESLGDEEWRRMSEKTVSFFQE